MNIHHHHHQVTWLAQISPTFSVFICNSSLLATFPNYILCLCRSVVRKFLLVD